MENERKVKQNAEVLRNLIKNVDVNALPYLEAGGRLIPRCKKGSEIHIKKANRGKFTDYCNGKVTNECITKGKKSSNPAVRKRATFAQNVRKWNK